MQRQQDVGARATATEQDAGGGGMRRGRASASVKAAEDAMATQATARPALTPSPVHALPGICQPVGVVLLEQVLRHVSEQARQRCEGVRVRVQGSEAVVSHRCMQASHVSTQRIRHRASPAACPSQAPSRGCNTQRQRPHEGQEARMFVGSGHGPARQGSRGETCCRWSSARATASAARRCNALRASVTA